MLALLIVAGIATLVVNMLLPGDGSNKDLYEEAES